MPKSIKILLLSMYHCLFSKWQFRLKDLSIPDFIGLMSNVFFMMSHYIIFFYKTFITVIYICRLSYTWVFFNTVSCKIPQKDFYKGNTYIFFFPKKCFRPKKCFLTKFFFTQVKKSSRLGSTIFEFKSSQKVESTRL